MGWGFSILDSIPRESPSEHLKQLRVIFKGANQNMFSTDDEGLLSFFVNGDECNVYKLYL